MTKVEEAIAEVEAQLAELAPPLEGLHDFGRLNLAGPSNEIVVARIAVYEQRKSLLLVALAALQALMADGHPDLEVFAVPPAVLADLSQNAETIEAALATFEALPPQASSLAMTAGPAEPKA